MTAPLRILVVDDDRTSRDAMAQQLRKAGYLAESSEGGPPALARIGAGAWDVILTDLRVAGADGPSLLREVKRRAADVDVIVTSAQGSVESAVAAMQAGAADYVTKPLRFAELHVRLQRIAQLRDSKRELLRLRAMLDEEDGLYGIHGRSPGIARVRERIELFAEGSAPVLVTGETGTGKELVARALHENGDRKHGPFVAIACGAIPPDLAEATLFGQDKRRGCFEEASDGTLLLDYVDELPFDVQAKLLRVLQDRAFRRVGGAEDVPADVRIVATTKVDLAALAQQGRFRDDLLYRLRGLEIHVPPLRDRGDDVLLLAHHFLARLATGGAQPKTLTPAAADVLRRYSWPGNVRELRRILESAVALARGPEIDVPHLPPYVQTDRRAETLFTLHLEHCAHVELPALLARIEQEALRWALARAHGQQTRAAEMLGIPRTTLQSKIGRIA